MQQGYFFSHVLKPILTLFQGNRRDLSLLLRKTMLASGVGATPLVHAASLPNLQADEAINLARDLEASDV
jgi:hypothetical protein